MRNPEIYCPYMAYYFSLPLLFFSTVVFISTVVSFNSRCDALFSCRVSVAQSDGVIFHYSFHISLMALMAYFIDGILMAYTH